ncbi:MAG TPA: hypothetical protein VL460_09275 [Caulobacteraceae bacterium]|nr:hypothetical protein [Caulobacteraceae bacterium]
MKPAVIAIIAASALSGWSLAPTAAAAAAAAVDPRPYNAHDLTGVWTHATRPNFGPFPFTPEYAAIQKAEQDAAAAGRPNNRGQNPCVPAPLIFMMTLPTGPLEVSAIGDDRLVISKSNGSIYRVYLKRPHPAPDDVEPLLYGDSVGRWDGDTLVIDTVGLGASSGDAGGPHSDVLHVVQRLRRTAYNKLENQLTIDDAKALTRPVTGSLIYDLTPEVELGEFYCTNERIIYDKDGKVGIAPAK